MNFIAIVLSLTLFAAGCGHAEEPGIKIVTWNVQTFFDAVNDGNEYSEFRKSDRWSQNAYEARLKTLCGAIKKLDAEVYVLEEVEKADIIYDISNALAGDVWHRRKKLNYALFAKDAGSSIGCAVLSRLPLSNATVHSLDIRTEQDKQPMMRPLIEVTVTKNKRPLTIYVNHWKSKAGGEEKSERWRNWQESVLAGRILRLGEGASISCGDFNRDISEFSAIDCGVPEDARAQPPNVLLRYAGFFGARGVETYSPWLDEDASAQCGSQGSYFFRESWERIDHFFAAGGATLREFTVATGAPWTNPDGTPDSYKVYSGFGCSDHLPLLCTIFF